MEMCAILTAISDVEVDAVVDGDVAAFGVVFAVVKPVHDVSATPVVPVAWASADGRVIPVWFSGARVTTPYDIKNT